MLAVVRFQFLALDQRRRCRAGAVPAAQVQAGFVETISQIRHHARQKAQFERGVMFDFLDGNGREFSAPILHDAHEIRLVFRRASALDHAVSDSAERRLKEAENVENPDMRRFVQALFPARFYRGKGLRSQGLAIASTASGDGPFGSPLSSKSSRANRLQAINEGLSLGGGPSGRLPDGEQDGLFLRDSV
jgi:hypothetical protein